MVGGGAVAVEGDWTKDIHIFVQFVRPSVGLLCGRVSNVD